MAFRILLCILMFGLGLSSQAQEQVDSLLDRLDRTMARSDVFIQQKENTITALKKQERRPGLSDAARFQFNTRLLAAYRQYRFDSALHYVNVNLDLAQSVKNEEWITVSTLQLSEILISSGLYKEAIESLSRIRPKRLKDSLKIQYYHAQKLVYEALREYAQDSRFAPEYTFKAKAYQDSLLHILPTESNEYQLEYGIRQMNEGNLDESETILVNYYKTKIRPGTAQYAGATAVLAYLYRLKGKPVEERQFRILSAISDIEAVVKENTSLTELAIRFYDEGEIERANSYIAYAMADANFFNARQRKIEIAKIYPIITKAYQLQAKKQEDRLRTYIWTVTGISVLLLLAILMVYLQKQKLSKARQYLHELNDELKAVNTNLSELNERLQEANFIKEEYIGHFLNQCSAYIDKLESYQKKVHRLVVSKQQTELLRLSESPDFIKAELAEFYHNFDQAFLQLFPDFVTEFNGLLDKSQAVSPKKGELLTTELRIFALIRLGIHDSYKIAHFLRYSSNTIYNYRAQIKNKASVDREQFEKLVMRIGTEIKKD